MSHDSRDEIPAGGSDTWERAPIPVSLSKPESFSATEVLELLLALARDRVTLEEQIEAYANRGDSEMMDLRRQDLERLTVLSAKLRNIRNRLGTLHETPF